MARHAEAEVGGTKVAAVRAGAVAILKDIDHHRMGREIVGDGNGPTGAPATSTVSLPAGWSTPPDNHTAARRSPARWTSVPIPLRPATDLRRLRTG